MFCSHFKEIINAKKYCDAHGITQTGCRMTEETMKHQHHIYMPEHAPMGSGDRIIYISLKVLSFRSILILYTKRERGKKVDFSQVCCQTLHHLLTANVNF